MEIKIDRPDGENLKLWYLSIDGKLMGAHENPLILLLRHFPESIGWKEVNQLTREMAIMDERPFEPFLLERNGHGR